MAESLETTENGTISVMENAPLVSICIPTYNRADMVGMAIDSALAQSYQNIEVLVVDNASQDNIESVVAGYHDSRLKFYKNSKNLGLFGNFNRCVELSRGEYIHILHSDDFIDPHFTETCVEFLESHPNVAMTFGSVQPSEDVLEKKKGTTILPVIYNVPDGFKKILEVRSFISCPTVMMRREIYDIIGLYSLEYPYSGDFYQWLRISLRFKIASVPNALLFYRTGTHSESFHLLFKTPLGYLDAVKIFVSIVDDLGDNQKFYQRELNLAYRRHMRDCLFAGIARSESMTSYSSMIFIGVALSTLSLIRPLSVFDLIKKCGNFFLICATACAIIIPGGRYCVRKLFWLDTKGY